MLSYFDIPIDIANPLRFGSSDLLKTVHCNSHGILHGSGAVGKLID